MSNKLMLVFYIAVGVITATLWVRQENGLDPAAVKWQVAATAASHGGHETRVAMEEGK